jgi:hypothetical protein
MLAAPGAAAWAIAGDWRPRVALAVAAVVAGAVHLIPRAYRGFAVAGALPLLATAPLWAFAGPDPIHVYASIALLVLATIAARAALAAAVPLCSMAAAGLAGGAASAVLAAATGGTVTRTGWSDWADVTAVLLLTAAAVVASHVRTGRQFAGLSWAAAPGLVVAAAMAASAAHVPWPWLPATALAAGLLGLLASSLSTRVRVVAPVALLIGAVGLTGLHLSAAAMLSGLGAALVAGVVAGLAGRTLPARIAGWVGSAAAAVAFAVTASEAAGLPLRTAAFTVLGVAAVLLLVGTIRAGWEGRVLEAAGHGAAVVALLLTTGAVRHAAAICTLWGIALGLRALRPGPRRVLVVGAATAELGAWWLLLSAQRVAVLEAYTLPAAAVAVLAGWLALRSRADLSSWVSMGPALAAALLPTLASVLVDEGQPVRRLLLGLGALAVVLAGAKTRLQAPVMAGGAVLTLVALHELVLVWDLLPRWIPLATAGLLLVGLAMTLERRRRDLARMRAALTRMT